MRMRKHFATGAALAAAAALVLTACGGGGSTGSAGGTNDTLTAGVAYETTDYGPITTSALGMGTNWQVLEGLYRLDRTDYSVSPALAAGDPVMVSDTEYEISLRDGAKFSDGTDVTAEDVVAAFGKATAEGSIFGQFFTFIDSMEAKDTTTVTVHLKHPFASLKERLAILMVTPASADAAAMKSSPIGSGPYKYTEVGEQKVVAVPNEYYNGNAPATVDTINWLPLKDDTPAPVRRLRRHGRRRRVCPRFRAGRPHLQGLEGRRQARLRQRLHDVQHPEGPFDKPEVRRAFLRAINRQALIDTALDGQAVPATSFLPEANPFYKKPSTDLSYDKDAAAKLLSDAGVSGLTINLTTTDHPWIVAMVPQIKADLEAIGVTVTHEASASNAMYSNITDVDNPTYDVIIAPGDPSVFGNDPGIIMSWWNGDNIWSKKRDGWQVSDPDSFNQLQGIIEEAGQVEGDAAKAKWGEAQDLLAEKTVLFPLVFRNVLTGSNPEKVDGFEPIACTGLQLVGVSAK